MAKRAVPVWLTGNAVVDDQTQADFRWLAYELHDGLLQWVISSRMQVESVLVQLRSAEAESVPEEVSTEEGYGKLELVHRSLGAAIEEGRQLIGFLEHTAAAGEIDFTAAVDRMSHELQAELAEQQQELKVLGFQEACWRQLPANAGWNLMRIVQQAVRNAIRHAGPCQITLEGHCLEQGQLFMRVKDTGRGFDLSAAQASNRFGLSSLEHRARLLQAQFEMESHVGQGTEVRLQLRGSPECGERT